MQYDIVIPHYGRGKLTGLCLRCLETIREHSQDYRILFIDNASPEFEAIEPELNKHPHLLVRNTENVGFVKATNQGIWLSTAPYVVLMNNDTEAVPGWLEKLEEGFQLPVGIVGPMMRVDKNPDDPIFEVSKPCWQSTWQRRGCGPLILPESSMVAFFCVMVHRALFEELGALDEGYGVGFADDDEFCYRVHRAGYNIALQQDLEIPHHHRSTFAELYESDEIRQMQKRAIERFRCMLRSSH